ncbi:MAG TPA: response regulator transcription factor [Acetobacteraceae bacterium]
MIRKSAPGPRNRPARATQPDDPQGTEDDDGTQESPQTPINRVLLVDESTITRQSLLHLLDANISNTVTWGAAGLGDLPSGRLDLALINIHAAHIDDPAIRAQVAAVRRHCRNDLPVAVITDLSQAARALAAIHREELQGYIPTHLKPAIVAAAVRLILAGGIYIPQELISADHHRLSTGGIDGGGECDSADTGLLTSREADVRRLLRLGKPNKIIAYELSISESTVKVHIRNIMKKLHATNRTQVALSAENGHSLLNEIVDSGRHPIILKSARPRADAPSSAADDAGIVVLAAEPAEGVAA